MLSWGSLGWDGMRSGRGCDLIKVQRPVAAGTGAFRVSRPGRPPAGTRCARLYSVDSVSGRGVGPWTAMSTPPTTSSPLRVPVRSCTITRLAFANVRSGKRGHWISSCFLQSIPPRSAGADSVLAQSLRPFLSLTILQHGASAPSHGCCSKLGGSPARRRLCVAICLPFSSRPCGHDAPLEGL